MQLSPSESLDSAFTSEVSPLERSLLILQAPKPHPDLLLDLVPSVVIPSTQLSVDDGEKLRLLLPFLNR